MGQQQVPIIVIFSFLIGGQSTFVQKGQKVSILGFMGCTICCIDYPRRHSANKEKAALNSAYTNECDCVPTEL